MAVIACPHCGKPVTVPEKNRGLWWGIGCLLAVPALFLVIAMIGVIAAIAIPSFARAREAAQMNVCVSNMRQIDVEVKRQDIENAVEAEPAANKVSPVAQRAIASAPKCPSHGTYTVDPKTREPRCSVHGRMSNPSHGRYTETSRRSKEP